jgi:hypothetical protein
MDQLSKTGNKKTSKKINHEILKLRKIPPVSVFDFLSNNFYL